MKEQIGSAALGAVSRRALLASGVAATLLTGEASADDAYGPERTFEGDSKTGNIQEALEMATKKLSGALGDGGAADATATWTVQHVTGMVGGLVPPHSVKVTITARRTPPWKKA